MGATQPDRQTHKLRSAISQSCNHQRDAGVERVLRVNVDRHVVVREHRLEAAGVEIRIELTSTKR